MAFIVLAFAMTAVAVGWGIRWRRRAKAATAASLYLEERYALATAASEEGFWDWVVATDEVYVSPRLLEIYDFPPGTIFASREDSLARFPIHPEDRPQWQDALDAHFAGETARFDEELRILRGDETRWLHVTGVAIRDDAGEVVRWTGAVKDVTARKRVEEALRISEERFALAVLGAEDGIWDRNLATGMAYASPRAQEITFGRPSDGVDLRPESEWAQWFHLHPDDMARRDAAARDHMDGRTPRYESEWRVRHQDGSYHWVHSRGICMRDASGRAVRLAGSITDIDARKRTEEALRVSEERFALAVLGAKDGIWDRDLTTGMHYLSPRAQEVSMGRPSDGVDVRHESEWAQWFQVHPDDAARRLAATRDHLKGLTPRYEGEWRVRHQNGSYHWIQVRGICTRDASGRAVRFAGSTSDIDARKRTEEALRSRQEMLELAQKAARAVAFDWQLDVPDGECGRLSPELEAMFGLTAASYDSGFKSWKELVHPEDWPAVSEELLRANETGNVATEYRVVHHSGAVRWLQAKGKMLFDAGGKPVRMIGFMLDVTDRHEAEDELRRLEKQLRQAQRLEAMGTLAGGIAHDFNNILGAILGYGEMALRDAPRGSRLRRDLDSINAAGERGRALVERILAFSRSGMSERVAVHVEKIVRESIDLLSASLPPGVTVATDLRAGRAAIRGDPTQVHQVVMNLATNGVQAMTSGGLLRVLLDTVRVDSPRIATTGTVAAGDYVRLKVTDRGSGIPTGILDRIFDPFFTTKEVGVGTGLGLSLVHGIVTEVGGAIDVETAPGSGSVFTVYLPRAGDAVDRKDDETPELPRGDGQRVLVVDDEEPLVRLTTQTLEGLGYAPAGFTSSTAALEAFRANPAIFDAVITDERMPGLSGSALIREVRDIRRTIPILLVCGYLGGTVADRGYNAGADEVLKKPLSARDLANSLARVLQE
jgi:PAS domain S-box-containing protein